MGFSWIILLKTRASSSFSKLLMLDVGAGAVKGLKSGLLDVPKAFMNSAYEISLDEWSPTLKKNNYLHNIYSY